MSRIYNFDAQLLGGHQNRRNVSTAQHEYLLDIVSLQHRSDQFSTVTFRFLIDLEEGRMVF